MIVVQTDVHAFGFGQAAGGDIRLHVEADDDGLGGGGEHDVVLADVAGLGVQHLEADLALAQFVEFA